MMNIKTWLNICRSSTVIFILVAAGMTVPSDHWLTTVTGVATLVLIVLGIWGAALGLKLVFSTLYFGCPQCSTKSKVIGGNKREMFMECPQCGELRLSSIFWGKLKIESTEQDFEGDDLKAAP